MWDKYWGPERDEFSDRPGIRFLPDHIGWLDPCDKVLDLGCGIGNLVERLTSQGKFALGVTYQRREVDVAVSRGRMVIQADMHNLPLKDETFDGMVMWDSLEHCVSPYIALCEARRAIRSGGRGLLFIPGPDWQNCRYHVIVPNKEQMVHLFKQSGWRLHELCDVSTKEQPGMYIYKVVNDPTYIPTFER